MKRRGFLELTLDAVAAASFVLPARGQEAALAGPPFPLIATAHGPSPRVITRAAIEAIGGMGRFVHRGDSVVIKPNIGWDRTPEQAANTNPDVVAELTVLCLAAGARSVLVMDNPCNDPRRCYLRSGIADQVRSAGGRIEFFDEERTRKTPIRGERLHEWPVHPAFIEADVLVNVPIAKHHGLAGLTLGMKNWLGAIGGTRNRLHQDIDRSIVDLAAFFRPDLTVIDGVRILTRDGPQGGSLDDVRRLDTVIASADPVAAEVLGAALHDVSPDTRVVPPHIALAEARGLGRSHWIDREEKRIDIPAG